MELVFALITYLGVQKIDESYFRDIDACRYFAIRINENVGVPNKVDDKGAARYYKAVCEPKKVNIKRVKIY